MRIEYCLTFFFSRGGVVSVSPNPQAGELPLVGCPRLLIQYIRSYHSYRRPFLHTQPEDAPCRGDRDPQTRALVSAVMKFRVPQNAGNFLISCKTGLLLKKDNAPWRSKRAYWVSVLRVECHGARLLTEFFCMNLHYFIRLSGPALYYDRGIASLGNISLWLLLACSRYQNPLKLRYIFTKIHGVTEFWFIIFIPEVKKMAEFCNVWVS